MAENHFEALVRRSGTVPVIDMQGEVNAFAEEPLNAAFREASLSQPERVLLNFRDVTYINSTGIALIVALLAQARKTRMALLVTGLSEHYRHIFSITRLADFMTIYDNEDAAVAQAGPAVAET